MDASAMGESINIDYNWDNLSVGNFNSNRSGNFFGEKLVFNTRFLYRIIDKDNQRIEIFRLMISDQLMTVVTLNKILKYST